MLKNDPPELKRALERAILDFVEGINALAKSEAAKDRPKKRRGPKVVQSPLARRKPR